MSFFETIPGSPHTTLHTRVWEHPGAIVDLGCAGWDWCAVFLGKKRVVGADPDLRVPIIPNADLLQTQVGPYNGLVSFCGSTHVGAHECAPQASMWAWKRFYKAAIDSKGIAALKINIEGGEWPLLASMDEDDFAPIDQLAVSFHDFAWPKMAKSTQALVGYLESLGYTSRHIYPPLNWWLFYKTLDGLVDLW